MNYVKSFPARFIVNTLIALVFVTCAFGYNRYTHNVDFGNGFASLASVFGGFTSFLALLGLAMLAVGIWWSVTTIADNDDIENKWVGALALAYVVIALVVGKLWLDVPAGISLIILGFVLVTVAQTWLNRFLTD